MLIEKSGNQEKKLIHVQRLSITSFYGNIWHLVTILNLLQHGYNLKFIDLNIALKINI